MSGSYLLDTNVFINAIRRQLQLPAAHYAYSVEVRTLSVTSFHSMRS